MLLLFQMIQYPDYEGEYHEPQPPMSDKGSAKCGVCGKEFPLKCHLRRHMVVHQGLKRYSCAICGNSFRYHHHLYTHRKILHNAPPYQCAWCDESYDDVPSFHEHKRQMGHQDRKIKL